MKVTAQQQQQQTMLYHPIAVPAGKGIISWKVKAPPQLLICNEEQVGYTSLRDVIPDYMRKRKKNLPAQEVIPCGYRTPIKNPLVERAARAYLQPTVEKCKLNKKKFSSFYRKLTRCLSFSSMVSKRLKTSFVEAFGCLMKLLKAPFGFKSVIC